MSNIGKQSRLAGLTLLILLFGTIEAMGQCGDPACTSCVQTSCDSGCDQGCCDSGSKLRTRRAKRNACGDSCNCSCNDGCESCESVCNDAGCAQRGGCRAKRGGCGLAGCRAPRERCPRCSCEVCELKVDEVKAKKTCYKVETEIICVPTPRFPWQRCEQPSVCSPTLKVKRLKKHTYECPECDYEWKVVKSQESEFAPGGAVGSMTMPLNQPVMDSNQTTVPQAFAPQFPETQFMHNATHSSRQHYQSGGQLRAIIERSDKPRPQIDWTYDGRK